MLSPLHMEWDPVPHVVPRELMALPSPLLFPPLEIKSLQMRSFISEFPSGLGNTLLQGLLDLGLEWGWGTREVKGGKGDI